MLKKKKKKEAKRTSEKKTYIVFMILGCLEFTYISHYTICF